MPAMASWANELREKAWGFMERFLSGGGVWVPLRICRARIEDVARQNRKNRDRDGGDLLLPVRLRLGILRQPFQFAPSRPSGPAGRLRRGTPEQWIPRFYR